MSGPRYPRCLFLLEGSKLLTHLGGRVFTTAWDQGLGPLSASGAWPEAGGARRRRPAEQVDHGKPRVGSACGQRGWGNKNGEQTL